MASADVTVNSFGDGETPIFSGKDGLLYVDKNGKIGFRREVYGFDVVPYNRLVTAGYDLIAVIGVGVLVALKSKRKDKN